MLGEAQERQAGSTHTCDARGRLVSCLLNVATRQLVARPPVSRLPSPVFFSVPALEGSSKDVGAGTEQTEKRKNCSGKERQLPRTQECLGSRFLKTKRIKSKDKIVSFQENGIPTVCQQVDISVLIGKALPCVHLIH